MWVGSRHVGMAIIRYMSVRKTNTWGNFLMIISIFEGIFVHFNSVISLNRNLLQGLEFLSKKYP